MSSYWYKGMSVNEAGNGIAMNFWSYGIPQSRLPLTVEIRAQFSGDGRATGTINPAILGNIGQLTGTGSAGGSAITSAILGVVAEFLAEGKAKVGERSLNLSELTSNVSTYTQYIRDITVVVGITGILGNYVEWNSDGSSTVLFTASATSDLLGNFTVTGQATVSIDAALGTASNVTGNGQATGLFTAIIGNAILWNSDGKATAYVDGVLGLQGYIDGEGRAHGTISNVFGHVVQINGDGNAEAVITGQVFKQPIIHSVRPAFLPVNAKKINLYIFGENFPLGCVATWTASPPVPLQTRRSSENKLVVKIPGELLQSRDRMGVINITVPQIQDLSSEGFQSQPAGGGKPVARLGDMSTGHFPFPARPNDQASTNVFANGIGVHRQGDHWVVHCAPICHDGRLQKGSKSVFTNSKQTGRVSDPIDCGDIVATGSPNVFIGMESRKSWFNSPTPWSKSDKEWGDI